MGNVPRLALGLHSQAWAGGPGQGQERWVFCLLLVALAHLMPEVWEQGLLCGIDWPVTVP